ncbi:MAG TPA: FmdB family zinc ribbon protein [Longimicrobiales bacterium]|nr:FmdB family zinc ribbon protein [Longimicrobiales bacterium]
MPLYEYTCRECGADFELRLKYEERLNPHACPACQSRHTLLRLSAPAAVGVAAGAADVPICGSTGQPCGCGRAAMN